MRKKRFCAWLLSLAMLVSLTNGLSISALAATPATTVPVTITDATAPGFFLKDLEVSQSGAWNLTITSKRVIGDGPAYAVVLREDLYKAAGYDTDSGIANLGAGNYNNLVADLHLSAANSPYYKYQYGDARGSASAPGTLELMNTQLQNFQTDNAYRTNRVGESSTTYHMKYVAIIFDGIMTKTDLSCYTIIKFSIDSEGYLQRESYMLRYMANKYPNGTSTGGNLPTYKIEGWGTDATVDTSKTPTRQGYSFLGWDPNPNLMPADPNTAAANPATAKFPTGSAGPVLWTDIAAKFKEAKPAGYGTDAYEKDLDKFYNLYAVWKPDKVAFNTANTETKTVTVDGKPQAIPVKTLPSPQVGKAFTATVPLVSPTTNSGTGKSYVYVPGVTVPIEGGTTTTINLATAASASDSALRYNLGITGANMSCTISGTPTGHSNGKEVYALLKVTDNVNGTTDLILIRFAEIKKGAQPIPTLDDNTGLQSRIQEVGEGEERTKDGQIFGFYSAGPTIESADNLTGYYAPTGDETTGTNGIRGKTGAGTMAGYYGAKRMVYQYRPAKVTITGEDGNSEQVTLVNQTTGEVTPEGEAYFRTLPNAGWREIPMTENYYPVSRLTQAVRTKLDDSMKKNAQIVMTTEYAPNTTSHAPVAEVTDKPEGFAGWPDGYGYITFDSTLPTLHGLAENDVYEIRFRANSSYEVSESRWISIGGAVASGGGDTVSGGMAVNLAGGAIEGDLIASYTEFVERCHALTAGQSIEIPEWTPIRENYSFRGWTLGERDEAGELILYNYVAPPTSEGGDTEETDPGDEGSGDEGAGDQESGDDDPPEAYEPVKVTMGDKPTALAAVWNATADGFVTIVCMDWDDTLLGSVTVPKGEVGDTVEDVYMKSFERSKMSENSKDYNADNTSYYVDDAEKPLTYKRGYSFYGWLPNDSTDLTHCGRTVDGDNNPITLPDPETQDFDNLQSNITVKACYKDNTELYYPDDPALMKYTMETASYNRIGATTNYVITYRFLRQMQVANEETGEMEIRGVPRLAEPQLRLVYNGAQYNFFALATSDETTFTIYPNANITNATSTMVDFYGASILTNASDKANLVTDTNGTSPTDHNGFRHKGTLSLINDQLETNSKQYLTAVVLRVQAGLTYTSLPTAQENLRKAWLTLNTTDGTEATLKPVSQRRDLTFDEMNYAIANGGGLPS